MKTAEMLCSELGYRVRYHQKDLEVPSEPSSLQSQDVNPSSEHEKSIKLKLLEIRFEKIEGKSILINAQQEIHKYLAGPHNDAYFVVSRNPNMIENGNDSHPFCLGWTSNLKRIAIVKKDGCVTIAEAHWHQQMQRVLRLWIRPLCGSNVAISNFQLLKDTREVIIKAVEDTRKTVWRATDPERAPQSQSPAMERNQVALNETSTGNTTDLGETSNRIRDLEDQLKEAKTQIEKLKKEKEMVIAVSKRVETFAEEKDSVYMGEIEKLKMQHEAESMRMKSHLDFITNGFNVIKAAKNAELIELMEKQLHLEEGFSRKIEKMKNCMDASQAEIQRLLIEKRVNDEKNVAKLRQETQDAERKNNEISERCNDITVSLVLANRSELNDSKMETYQLKLTTELLVQGLNKIEAIYKNWEKSQKDEAMTDGVTQEVQIILQADGSPDNQNLKPVATKTQKLE